MTDHSVCKLSISTVQTPLPASTSQHWLTSNRKGMKASVRRYNRSNAHKSRTVSAQHPAASCGGDPSVCECLTASHSLVTGVPACKLSKRYCVTEKHPTSYPINTEKSTVSMDSRGLWGSRLWLGTPDFDHQSSDKLHTNKCGAGLTHIGWMLSHTYIHIVWMQG